MKYCKYCMAQIEDNAASCPACGRDLTTEEPLHRLRPGTVLAGRYTVGAALGEGGFGITYLGINTDLDLKVAIKEYFPFGYVYRMTGESPSVTSRSENTDDGVFEKGKAKFLSEAKTLAKLNSEPGVVSVYDFFKENNTAYIVMEYLEGETLKAHLQKNKRISYDDTLSLLMPAMLSLSKVHERGLIHRDISPDNIMLTGKSAKLLDFGAARYADGEKSLSVMLKHGYAPEEQYRRTGEQGPWTDVYALSATIYKCITGTTPNEATERTFKDTLKPPSAYGVQIDPRCEAALMKGLAVYANDRYRTVKELIKGLLGKDEAPAAVPVPAAGGEKPEPNGKTVLKGKKADGKTVRRGKTDDYGKTVIAVKANDPDKTVYGDDPDKTVFGGNPSSGKAEDPPPEYKEKTKINKKALLTALISVLVAAVIIGTVIAVSLNKGKGPAPVLPSETTHEDTHGRTEELTEEKDTEDATEPSVIPVSTEEPESDTEPAVIDTEPQTDPVTTETPVTEKPADTEHVHTYGGWITVREATCTETGEEERVCTVCSEKEIRTVDAKGHTPVTDEAVAATCTEPGKTEGSHCSVCGAVITEQTAVAALGHDFGAYQQTKAPTCTETGAEQRTCSRCGKTESRTVAATGHTVVIDAATVTCTEAGKTEGSHCSVCGAVIKAQTNVAALGHDYGNSNQCSRCKDINVECFSLRLNDDGTYDIRAKDKNNMPAEVVIPSTYNGKPVTSIGKPKGAELGFIGGEGFRDCSGIKSISIPDSIAWINGNAFCECSGLEKLEVAKGNKVYHSAGNCLIETESKTLISGCKNSVIPSDGSVTSIDDYAFSGCSGLTSITIPDSVTSIGVYAFSRCTGLTNVTIPNSVTSIGEAAFYGCSGLTSITIGNGVTSIGLEAFENCSKLNNVKFKNPNGWKATSFMGEDSVDLSPSQLEDPATAAEYLTSTYCDYFWERS